MSTWDYHSPEFLVSDCVYIQVYVCSVYAFVNLCVFFSNCNFKGLGFNILWDFSNYALLLFLDEFSTHVNELISSLLLNEATMVYKIPHHHWEFPHKTAIKQLKKNSCVLSPHLISCLQDCLHVLSWVPERVWVGGQGWWGHMTQIWAIKAHAVMKNKGNSQKTSDLLNDPSSLCKPLNFTLMFKWRHRKKAGDNSIDWWDSEI